MKDKYRYLIHQVDLLEVMKRGAVSEDGVCSFHLDRRATHGVFTDLRDRRNAGITRNVPPAKATGDLTPAGSGGDDSIFFNLFSELEEGRRSDRGVGCSSLIANSRAVASSPADW